MAYHLARALVFGAAWLMAAIPSVKGADMAHFQAMQLTRFSQATLLPDESLPNVEGKMVSLRSFRGQVVLVNFWTTW